jgi:predicted amidophosphoribosyltransferase
MKCDECGQPADHDVCSECCEHGDIDDMTCLICGHDMTESIMSRAYDQAKDQRKYGDL